MVENDTLLLLGLDAWQGDKKADLKTLFPKRFKDEKVKADWFTGRLYLSKLFGLDADSGILNFKNGKLIPNKKDSSNKDSAAVSLAKTRVEKRDITDIDELHLNIPANLTITVGDKVNFEITASPDILPMILTKSKNKVLSISGKENFPTDKHVEITLQVPNIRRAVINGTGTVDFKNLKNTNLDLQLNGIGSIIVKGSTDRLSAVINGVGKLEASELKTSDAVVTIYGSGEATVYATNSLSAVVNGPGSITYAGNPKKVTRSAWGLGKVRKK